MASINLLAGGLLMWGRVIGRRLTPWIKREGEAAKRLQFGG